MLLLLFFELIIEYDPLDFLRLNLFKY